MEALSYLVNDWKTVCTFMSRLMQSNFVTLHTVPTCHAHGIKQQHPIKDESDAVSASNNATADTNARKLQSRHIYDASSYNIYIY